jgi:hypothetical protein
VRIFGRDWFGIQNAPGSFVITNSAGIPIFQSGLPAGQQYPKGQGKGRWVEVSTDANGDNSLVYLTNLCQVILGNLNEDPLNAGLGLPARQSVLSGIPPDYNMALIQKRFAPYFQSLVITRRSATSLGATPNYLVNVVTNAGVKLSANIPIPV